jgi:hypothetical protein
LDSTSRGAFQTDFVGRLEGQSSWRLAERWVPMYVLPKKWVTEDIWVRVQGP